MKARETHIVLLSSLFVAALRNRWTERSNDTGLVFSRTGEMPISDVTMTKLLRDDGIAGIMVHGCRSYFINWAAQQTRFPKEVVDKA